MNKGAMQVERMEQAKRKGWKWEFTPGGVAVLEGQNDDGSTAIIVQAQWGCWPEKQHAELIAQAPDLKQQRDDLLAALKALKAYVDKEPCEYADPLGEADEAIARAEDRQ